MKKKRQKTPLVHLTGKLARVMNPHLAQQRYMWGALVLLLATTVYWSLLGANLHSTNADQLIDGYLFADKQSFGGAQFPGAHSMLVKWPIFWMVGALGANGWPLVGATVVVSVGTISGLAWLLSRIERRPFVLGTWFLALASVLLLVPLQPYNGGILPVQLAMLTTRNIEYILYIAGVVLILRAHNWRTPRFAAGVGLLGLLAASDKLFIGLGLGGAILMTAYGWLRHDRTITRTSYRLIMANGLVTVIAFGVQAGLTLAGLITKTSGADASPYPLVQTPRELLFGMYYAATGVLTNFGANPSFDALVMRDTVSVGLRRLLTVTGSGYIINGLLLIGIVSGVLHIVSRTPKQRSKKTTRYPVATLLSLMLVCSALVATALFVVTKHYHVVDARYLTIWLFAGFIAAATTVRTMKIKRDKTSIIGVVLLIALPLSAWGSWQVFSAQHAAYTTVTQRDLAVIRTLDEQKIDILVGDYWRVVPIRAASKRPLTVVPLGDCTNFRDTLTSTSWQKGLSHKPVAYLLSLEKSLTDFPACDQASVVARFGSPSRTITVAGDTEKPSELILLYENGFYHSVKPPTIAPLDSKPPYTCGAKSVMQIVAHPDDDLLFFNPDMLHEIRAKNCVQTIFLTAGDSGNGPDYWRERQDGIRAAYSQMLGAGPDWKNDLNFRFKSGQKLQLSTPPDNPYVTLAFLNLPDGSPRGSGFDFSAHQSLQKLLNGEIERIKTINSDDAYTSAELLHALDELFTYYKPTEVRTFAIAEPDHSDHQATGHFVRAAWEQSTAQGQTTAQLQTYLGYPIYEYDENVSGDDLTDKEAAFYSYGNHDHATCNQNETCMLQTVYGTYLKRQYRIE